MNAVKIKTLLESVLSTDEFFLNHCYIVGGFVRDILMKQEPKDLDIVVDTVQGSLKLGLKIHQALSAITTAPRRLGKYPIWQITFIDGEFAGNSIEIAETMSEQFPNKFSRQRETKFASLQDDIFRRDFTINSLLMKFCQGESLNVIIDYSGYGVKDILENHVIRCIPAVDAEEIFSADPLRILRAIRFAVRYNWQIEEKTYEAMKKVKDRLNILSVERIVDELEKTSKVEYGLLKAVKILNDIDGLKLIFPEVDHLKYINQSGDSRFIHLEGSEFSCKNFESK